MTTTNTAATSVEARLSLRGPCDTGDCARNYGGRSTGAGCPLCGFIHCDTCEGTRLVGDSGDIEFDTCSCDGGRESCVTCGEPATRRYQGRKDEGFNAAQHKLAPLWRER